MNAKQHQRLPPPLESFQLASTTLEQVGSETKRVGLPAIRVSRGFKRAVKMMAARRQHQTYSSYIRGAVLFRLLADIHFDSQGDERVLTQLLDNFHCPACRVVRQGLFHKKRGS